MSLLNCLAAKHPVGCLHGLTCQCTQSTLAAVWTPLRIRATYQRAAVTIPELQTHMAVTIMATPAITM